MEIRKATKKDLKEVAKIFWIESSKPPIDVFREKINFNIGSLNSLGEMDVNLIKMKSKGNNMNGYAEVSIGVNPLKPSKEFLFSIIKRDIDLEATFLFHTLIKESLESFINK